MANNTASFKWVKQVTEIGLTFMREKVREERINNIFDGADIDCDALVALIDECAAAAGVYLDSHDDRVSNADAEV
ncbi:MAG: hypothetical protein II820_06845 [Ruminiclostridium sp.]|nr:hypothetical protein [Ruminiclostridium sp.]